MELKITNKTITLPDELYLDQLLQLDLGMIQNMDKLSESTNMADLGNVIKWFLDFFKVIGVKERLTIQDFQELQKDDQLMNWFRGLLQGFQRSS